MRKSVIHLLPCILCLLTQASLLAQNVKGFVAKKSEGDTFEVRYSDRRGINDPVSEREHILVGNIGRLCVEQGKKFASISDAGLYRNEKGYDSHLRAVVELSDEKRDGSWSCDELAGNPATSKDAKKLRKSGKLKSHVYPFGHFKLAELKDEFNGDLTIGSDGNYLFLTLEGKDARQWQPALPVGDRGYRLNPILLIKSSGNKAYSVVLRYFGQSWLFIEKEESLWVKMVKIDGELSKLSAAALDRDVNRDGSVSETLAYLIDRDLIERIALASDVIVRIKGREGWVDRKLDEANFANFKWFGCGSFGTAAKRSFSGG